MAIRHGLLLACVICACGFRGASTRSHAQNFVLSRHLSDTKPLGWREYCDGGNWVYWEPTCRNSSKTESSGVSDQNSWNSKEKCGKGGQSPININFMHTSFKSFDPIYFLGYNVRSLFEVENGGHFLYITPQGASLETYGGPLPARYNLSKAIFRFGNETSDRGSEHTIDDRNFAAELQLLLSSEKPTPADCLRSGKGLAILVILFEKQERPNDLLNDLVRSTEKMTFRGNKTEMRIPLSYVLPNTTLKYYFYLGSLTFPPCTNQAYVVVFSNTVGIGEQQLTKLRNNLYSEVNNCTYRMAGNLRNQQPLGSRVVYRSFKFSSAGISTSASLALVIVATTGSGTGFSLNIRGF